MAYYLKNEINQNDLSLAIVLNSQSNISSRFELAESFEFTGFSEPDTKDTFVNLTQRGELTLPQFVVFLVYHIK